MGRTPHFPPLAMAWPSFCGAGPGRPVGVRRLAPTATGLETGPELELPIDSVVPVAAVAGPNRGGRPTVWVASIGGPDPRHPRAVIHHYVSEGGGRARFLEVGRNVVDGSFARRRLALLWRPNTGSMRGESTFSRADSTFCSRSVSRPSIPRGPNRRSRSTCATAPGTAGSHRRYYSPGDFDSRSAPGVCWFRDDIAYANRLHSPHPDRNDRLLLGFTATGAFDTMTDFNDFAFIAEIGLSHSLMMVSE